jgi:diguanylate cyclase (GGDEF)-like protein
VKPEADGTRRIQITIQQMTRRQMWMVSTGLVIALLTGFGMISFTYPNVVPRQKYPADLDMLVRGLIAFIVLFGIYVLYQQTQLRQMGFQVVGTLHNIQQITDRAQKLAGRDGLTNLYNKEFGEHRLKEEISRTNRTADPLTILRVGLVGLEEAAQRLGSSAADHAIQLFAAHIEQMLRKCDVAIRLDRGDFMVLLPLCKENEAEVILQRLKLRLDLGDLQATEIVGVFARYVHKEELQALLVRVETAFYENKQNGGAPKQSISITVSLPRTDDERIAQLTLKEREVLRLLVEGKVNKEVACILDTQLRTIETHRRNILAKLNVHSISELMIFAMKNGMVNRTTS